VTGGGIWKLRLLGAGSRGVGAGDECGIQGVFAHVDSKRMSVVFVVGGGGVHWYFSVVV
jgi:hypothetical protein